MMRNTIMDDSSNLDRTPSMSGQDDDDEEHVDADADDFLC